MDRLLARAKRPGDSSRHAPALAFRQPAAAVHTHEHAVDTSISRDVVGPDPNGTILHAKHEIDWRRRSRVDHATGDEHDARRNYRE
jgi:hypothetical protein